MVVFLLFQISTAFLYCLLFSTVPSERYVDDILTDAPFVILPSLVQQLGVSVVVVPDPLVDETPFSNLKVEMSEVLRKVPIVVHTVSCEDILERIASRSDKLSKNYKLKMEKEKKYSQEKSTGGGPKYI